MEESQHVKMVAFAGQVFKHANLKNFQDLA